MYAAPVRLREKQRRAGVPVRHSEVTAGSPEKMLLHQNISLSPVCLRATPVRRETRRLLDGYRAETGLDLNLDKMWALRRDLIV